jgi:hypothetical protein
MVNSKLYYTTTEVIVLLLHLVGYRIIFFTKCSLQGSCEFDLQIQQTKWQWLAPGIT